jgi:hypothetical protein
MIRMFARRLRSRKSPSDTGIPLRRALMILSGLALILSAGSCGGSKSSAVTPPTSTVTITPKTVTLSRGASRQFSATIAGATDQTVLWKVNGRPGGNASQGLISQGGVYIAPVAVPNPATISVTAVSFADPTKSATATVTIQSGSTVSLAITGSGAPVTVPTYGSHAFTATVSGTTNTAVTWQVNGVAGGSTMTGTITSQGVFSAPHSVPVSTAANNDGQTTDVIITAVSQADPSASDSAVVLIAPAQQAHFNTPIPLGTSGGNGKDTSTVSSQTFCCGGTLGSLVSRGGKLYLLSNTHVLARSDAASVGDPIVQPGLDENNCAVNGTVTAANLSQFFNLETGPLPNVDAAIAEIVPGAVDPEGTILQLGSVNNGNLPTDGTPNPGPGVSPTVGRNVVKSGSATGLTCAPILAINTSISIEYQKACNSGTTFTLEYVDQVDIGGVGFSAQGDSGSLIVTQDTADPVGLLYGGSDSDTVANPVADVLAQLADEATGERPLFVGDGTVGRHPVAACTLPRPQALAARTLILGNSAVTADALQAAGAARDSRAAELLARPEVLAVGVGASYDSPGEAALLVFVSKGQRPSKIPGQIDGVRTRIVALDPAEKLGSLSAAASAAVEETAVPPQIVYAIPESETDRARAVHALRAADWMKRPGVQGVGVSSSVDAPGEAALMIFVIRGEPHGPVPPVIDGLRTRVRETGRFRAR